MQHIKVWHWLRYHPTCAYLVRFPNCPDCISHSLIIFSTSWPRSSPFPHDDRKQTGDKGAAWGSLFVVPLKLAWHSKTVPHHIFSSSLSTEWPTRPPFNDQSSSSLQLRKLSETVQQFKVSIVITTIVIIISIIIVIIMIITPIQSKECVQFHPVGSKINCHWMALRANTGLDWFKLPVVFFQAR